MSCLALGRRPLLVLCALGALACGGEEFSTSTTGSGGMVTTGGAGGTAAGGVGGSAGSSAGAGGAVTGGAPPTGGRATTGGTTMTGGAGGSAGTGGAGATAGGGAGGDPAGGSGGSGGGDGGLGLESCGSVPPEDTAIFHTTLDSAGDVANPAIGDATGFTNGGTPRFVTALSDHGLEIDVDGEWIAYPQIVGGVANLNPQKGTVDFCFKPSFDSVAPAATALDRNYVLFRIETLDGFMQVRKANSDNSYALQVTASSAAGIRETNFPPSSFSFVAGQWVRLTISWRYNTTSLDGRQVRLFVNGGEIAPSGTGSLGPFLMQGPAGDESFFIGGNGAGQHAGGVFDELVVYPEPITP